MINYVDDGFHLIYDLESFFKADLESKLELFAQDENSSCQAQKDIPYRYSNINAFHHVVKIVDRLIKKDG